MGWIRYILSRYVFFIIIIVMVVIFLSSATSEEPLDVYTNGDSIYTVEKETEVAKVFSTFTYHNSAINLSMEIPDEWTYVLKDGFDTYIHSASASSIQIQVLSYYPMVNNMTYESVTETYSSRNLEVTEFSYLSDTSYYLIYNSKGNSGVTDYIELVLWDRAHVAKIIIAFNDLNYEKIKDELWYCIDSVLWEYEDPVPAGFYLSYQIIGDFEYAVPSGWTTGVTEGSFYACDSTGEAMFVVNVLEDTSFISDITQVDYVNFLSSGKTDFALSAYELHENSIYGEATYINNGSMYSIFQSYYANGTYHYILTYELPNEYALENMYVIREALNATRVFYTAPEYSSETEFQEEYQETENLDYKETEFPVNTDNMQPSEFSSEDTTPSNVPSFADALITVAGVSSDQAAYISDVWYGLNAGTPVYAEAYKESETDLILLIQNDQGVNYFMYITKNGELLKISVNTEDGPLIADFS